MDNQTEIFVRQCIKIFGQYNAALKTVLEMARVLQIEAGKISEERQQELAIKELIAKDLVMEAQTAEQNLYKQFNITTSPKE